MDKERLALALTFTFAALAVVAGFVLAGVSSQAQEESDAAPCEPYLCPVPYPFLTGLERLLIETLLGALVVLFAAGAVVSFLVQRRLWRKKQAARRGASSADVVPKFE